jgi:hypothetical protein
MSLPATILRTALSDAIRWLSRVVLNVRKMPRPKPVPLSHKDVEHQQTQIKAGARPFPPPRKR